MAYPQAVMESPTRRGAIGTLLVCLCLSLPAGGAIRNWPTGAAPCNNVNSLSACIDGADAGDIIEVTANAIPAQNPSIFPGKSLTIRPAAGFTPVFADSSSLTAWGDDSAVTVIIEGLTFARGDLSVIGRGTGPLNVTLRDNVVQSSGSGEPGGIRAFDLGQPTTLVIENNQVTMNGDPQNPGPAIDIFFADFDNPAGAPGGSVRIAGNRLAMTDDGSFPAINVAPGGLVGPVDVDVIGNRVSGSGLNGILILSKVGVVRVVNNVVSGQGGLLDGIGIGVFAIGSSSIQVVNNTVGDMGTGILFESNVGTPTALFANNIVAFNIGAGLDLNSASQAFVTNEFNLVHGNGSNNYTPGPGTLTSDPQFAAADYRLRTGSPARNTGSNSRVPADITTDFDGNPRILGIVDRGAYEQATGGSDADADGVADSVDNCSTRANATQCDSDRDGYGNRCDGDLNNSLATNAVDVTLFRQQLSQPSVGPTYNRADINCSGAINAVDTTQFRQLLGSPPGPSGLACAGTVPCP